MNKRIKDVIYISLIFITGVLFITSILTGVMALSYGVLLNDLEFTMQACLMIYSICSIYIGTRLYKIIERITC